MSGSDKNFALLIGRLIKSRKVYSTYLLISKMYNQTVLFRISPFAIFPTFSCHCRFVRISLRKNLPYTEKKLFDSINSNYLIQLIQTIGFNSFKLFGKYLFDSNNFFFGPNIFFFQCTYLIRNITITRFYRSPP